LSAQHSNRLLIAKDEELARILHHMKSPSIHIVQESSATHKTFNVITFSPHDPAFYGNPCAEDLREPAVRRDWGQAGPLLQISFARPCRVIVKLWLILIPFGPVQIARSLYRTRLFQGLQRFAPTMLGGGFNGFGAGCRAVLGLAGKPKIDDLCHRGSALGSDHVLGPHHAVKGFAIDIAQGNGLLPQGCAVLVGGLGNFGRCVIADCRG
jgi:hypothetical protein